MHPELKLMNHNKIITVTKQPPLKNAALTVVATVIYNASLETIVLSYINAP